MKKILIPIISIWLIHYNCKSQVTFSRLYNHYNPFFTWGVSLEQDSGYFYIFGSGATGIDPDQYKSAFLFKADSLGDEVLVKNYTQINTSWYANEPGTLKKIGYGKFICSSSFKNDSSMGILFCFNANCDTIFTRRFIGDGYTAFYNTDFKNDTIFAIGATRDTSLYYTYMYLVAIDTLGNTLFEHKYGNGIKDELGLSVGHFNNNKLAIGGMLENDATELSTDGKLYKTDKNGNEYYSKIIGKITDDSPLRLQVSRDNIHFYWSQEIDTLINADDYQYSFYLAKVDTNGNSIWRTFFNQSTFLEIWNFRENPDGSIITVGTSIIDSTGQLEGFIEKISADGAFLWRREYTTNPLYDSYFFDVQQTPDLGYIISGSGVGDIDGEPSQQLWLVKLDSMGCLEPGCGGTPVFNPPVNNNVLFAVFPNPVANTAIVEIHIPADFIISSNARLTLNLYDISGKLTDSYGNIPVNNPNEVIRFNIYKKDLATGIYQAVLNYDRQQIGSVKLLIQ